MRSKTSKDEELETIQANVSEGYPASCGTETKRMKILKERESNEQDPDGNSHNSGKEVFKADQRNGIKYKSYQ
jgi:hypothetical protein